MQNPPVIIRLPQLIAARIAQWLTISKKDTSPQPVYYTTRIDLEELGSCVQPGDILLRYRDHESFNPSRESNWQHAGLYYHHGQVIGATGRVTRMRKLEDFGRSDGMALLRIPGLKEEQLQQVLKYARKQVGKPGMQLCDLVVNAFRSAGIAYRSEAYPYPDDLLHLPGVEVVWTNREDLVRKSLRRG